MHNLDCLSSERSCSCWLDSDTQRPCRRAKQRAEAHATGQPCSAAHSHLWQSSLHTVPHWPSGGSARHLVMMPAMPAGRVVGSIMLPSIYHGRHTDSRPRGPAGPHSEQRGPASVHCSAPCHLDSRFTGCRKCRTDDCRPARCCSLSTSVDAAAEPGHHRAPMMPRPRCARMVPLPPLTARAHSWPSAAGLLLLLLLQRSLQYLKHPGEGRRLVSLRRLLGLPVPPIPLGARLPSHG